MDLKKIVRDVPDFPKKGILFHDVTPLFKNPEAFEYLTNTLAQEYKKSSANVICAMDARGFILGGALAYKLKCPLLLIRKKGKLPNAQFSQKYDLEYGSAEIEMQHELSESSKVFLIDDLVATGGTLLAAIRLIEKQKAKISLVASVIDMPDLEGSQKIKNLGHNFFSMIDYQGH